MLIVYVFFCLHQMLTEFLACFDRAVLNIKYTN